MGFRHEHRLQLSDEPIDKHGAGDIIEVGLGIIPAVTVKAEAQRAEEGLAQCCIFVFIPVANDQETGA